MSIHVDPSTWHLKTAAKDCVGFGPIPYKLVEGYPRGSAQADLAEFQEQYIIQSKDLINFFIESFPVTTKISDTDWVYHNPRTMPGSGNSLFTKKIDFEPLEGSKPCDPFQVDTGWHGAAVEGTYDGFLKLTITYDSTGFIEVSADAGAEFLMVPSRGKLQWINSENDTDVSPAVAAGQLVDVRDIHIPITKLVPQTQWKVKIKQVTWEVAKLIVDGCRDKLGKINDDTVKMLMNARFGTVLFVGYSLSTTATWTVAEGNVEDLFYQFPTEMEFEFLVKDVGDDPLYDVGLMPMGHNYFFRPDKLRWEQLVRYEAATQIKIYEYATLSTIAKLNTLLNLGDV